MDQAAYLRLIREERRGPAAALARSSLALIAAGYRLGVTTRNFAFDRGWKPSHRVQVPVVSVGNITLGGTGKTPMVEWVARWYRARGLRVAILSRGYGPTEGLNDEGRVLQQNLPDVPHWQGRDRVALARRAVEAQGSQLLVLDDGFQHRRLARDLDIVLLDALEPFGLGRLFPRGLLRETISALQRADVVVLSRADLVDASQRARIREEAERHAGPLRWVEARHAPLVAVNHQGPELSLGELPRHRVAAFCGLGNPEGFRRTLGQIGVTPLGFRLFPDHHPYTSDDRDALADWAHALKADLVLTTQKDSVKLRTANLGPLPLYALRIGLEILNGEAVLDEVLGRLTGSRIAQDS